MQNGSSPKYTKCQAIFTLCSFIPWVSTQQIVSVYIAYSPFRITVKVSIPFQIQYLCIFELTRHLWFVVGWLPHVSYISQISNKILLLRRRSLFPFLSAGLNKIKKETWNIQGMRSMVSSLLDESRTLNHGLVSPKFANRPGTSTEWKLHNTLKLLTFCQQIQ